MFNEAKFNEAIWNANALVDELWILLRPIPNFDDYDYMADENYWWNAEAPEDDDQGNWWNLIRKV